MSVATRKKVVRAGKVSFLQAHYNEFRRRGGKHSQYVVWNEISTETGEKLDKQYQKYRSKKQPRPKATR